MLDMGTAIVSGCRNWRYIAFAHYITTMHTLAPTWPTLNLLRGGCYVVMSNIYWSRAIPRSATGVSNKGRDILGWVYQSHLQIQLPLQQRCRDRIVHKLHIILNCDATHDLTIGLNSYPEPKKQRQMPRCNLGCPRDAQMERSKCDPMDCITQFMNKIKKYINS